MAYLFKSLLVRHKKEVILRRINFALRKIRKKNYIPMKTHIQRIIFRNKLKRFYKKGT